MDESAAERVAAAHAVDDVHLVLGGERGLLRLRVIEHAGPEVVEGGERGAQRDRHLLAAEALHELLGNGDIALLVELAALDVRALADDAEDIRRVRLVRDEDVDVRNELRHALAGLGLRPQLAAVVEVAGDGDLVGLAVLERVQADRGQLAAECGRDAGEVKPADALQNLLPVEVLPGRERDRAAGAVVDDLRGALRGALLREVDAKAGPAPDDVVGPHAEPTQLVARGAAERILRQLRHERGRIAVVRKRHSDVRLAARVGDLELVRLDEAVVALRIEAHHDFAECDNLFHGNLSAFISRILSQAELADNLAVVERILDALDFLRRLVSLPRNDDDVALLSLAQGELNRLLAIRLNRHADPRSPPPNSYQYRVDDLEGIFAAGVVGGDDELVRKLRTRLAHQRTLHRITISSRAEDHPEGRFEGWRLEVGGHLAPDSGEDFLESIGRMGEVDEHPAFYFFTFTFYFFKPAPARLQGRDHRLNRLT